MKIWNKWTKNLFCLALTASLSVSLFGCDLNQLYKDVSEGLDNFLSDSSEIDTDSDSSATESDSSDTATDSDGSDTATDSSDTTSGDSGSDTATDSSGGEDIITEELQIYFPSFQNKVSGDCTLIKVGDTEVLIDAGSTRGSAEVIVPYIQQYCTDGILEYVIATHAHEDHIAAFVGEDGTDGVFANFECKTIIDFVKKKTTSQISKDYETWRDKEVAAGAVHYTALECWNNANGAQKSYQLGDEITLNILYQKYYETTTSNENNYSVCTMISYGEKHFLFTGDLEESGEKSLVENNDLPVCELFKSGHHGSNTSNTTDLISVIQPKTVILTCCCGDKFNFPHQETINTIAPYTDKVYAPTVATANGWELLNGNITVTYDGTSLTVDCSKNNLLFKDTEWFKANRTLPVAWE